MNWDQQEAWGIASDLIEDMGAEDALGWADEYMAALEEEGDGQAVRRWRLVTCKLAEIIERTIH